MSVSKSEIMIGCVFISFLLVSPTAARHKHISDVICEGDRQEGDKWFDGCKWCVCQTSGPLCSPAQCSNLFRQVPPCTNLGSRWRDGCYDCRCHSEGIDCRADRACVVLMQSDSYQRQIMTPGACVEPEDDRCVCGVDGVPSCTVEVIDRNDHPATTIAFDLSLPYASEEFSPDQAPRMHSNEGMSDSSQEQRNPLRSLEIVVDNVASKRDNVYNGRASSMESHSNQKPRHHLTSSPQNDDWSNQRRDRTMPKYSEYSLESRNQVKSYDLSSPYIRSSENHEYDSNHQNIRSSTKHTRDRLYDDTVAAYLVRRSDRSNVRSRHRRTHRRYRRDAERKWRFARVRNSQGQLVHVPGSLLVISDNRCRYGIRWYGGSLRCFCDELGSVTCGDPSFVATRIDGFRLEKIPCEEGHSWEEEGSCQECTCKITGVVLCRRSEACPLPFLIRPVIYGDEYFDSSNELPHHSKDNDETDIRKRLPNQGSVDIDLGDDRKDEEDNVSNKGVVELNPRQKPLNPSIYGSTVIVQECKLGSRWMDGCKRCFCSNGRKKCDERRCLKPRPLELVIDPPADPHCIGENGRPCQRPPTMPVIRRKPVSIRPSFLKVGSCGRYKVRQVYWVKCNLCLCTSGGPRCTAKSCG